MTTLLTPFFPYSVFNNIHLSQRTSVCKELSGSHSVDDGHEFDKHESEKLFI